MTTDTLDVPDVDTGSLEARRSGPGRRWPRPARWIGRRTDLCAAAAYVTLAVYFARHLLRDLNGRFPAAAGGDHALFQWMFAHDARVVTEGINPFFTHQMNIPGGVNLMANTSILGLGIPMTPVTLLWGPQVSYAVVLVAGLAGTAYGWYWLYSRRLVTNRLAAVVGGAFCGFAPGILTHGEGHLNWTTQLLVPFIVDSLFRLREPGRAIRNGVRAAVLVTLQVFVAEEVLLYTALGVTVFSLVFATTARSQAWAAVRPVLKGLGVALAVSGVLLAYPLWFQFFGPQSYHGVTDSGVSIGNDLAAFVSFSTQSLAGDGASAAKVAVNVTEENSFFGWPLVVVCSFFAVWLWRAAIARAAVITAVVFGVLSLGRELVVAGHHTGIPGPWRFLAPLPLLDSVVPGRLAQVMIPALGAVLAMAIGRLADGAALPGGATARMMGAAAIVAALLPIFPVPVPTSQRWIPDFISARMWTDYVAGGRSLLVVSGDTGDTQRMVWAARSRAQLPIVGGYFLGPGGPEGRAMYGTPARPTTSLFSEVVSTGHVPEITDRDRRDAEADLRFWHVGALVLPERSDAYAPLRETVSDLLSSPGRPVGGVWLWDVRDLTAVTP